MNGCSELPDLTSDTYEFRIEDDVFRDEEDDSYRDMEQRLNQEGKNGGNGYKRLMKWIQYISYIVE